MGSNDLPMQTAPDHSPNEPITAHPGSHVSVQRLTMPHSPVQWFLAVAFVASVAMNAMCCWWIYLADRDAKLKDYDVSSLQSDVISPLQSQVAVQKVLIDGLETRMAVREECKR